MEWIDKYAEEEELLRREEDFAILKQELKEKEQKMNKARRRKLEFTDPGYPWFVGFKNLHLRELEDIRLDLLERLEEPQFLREGDEDAYVLWISQINDEILRRADQLLEGYNETMKVYKGE